MPVIIGKFTSFSDKPGYLKVYTKILGKDLETGFSVMKPNAQGMIKFLGSKVLSSTLLLDPCIM